MSKKHIGIIVSGIVIMATLTLCVANSGCLDLFAGEWCNSYNYWFSIECDKTLYNVTLYIPIPIIKGEIASIVEDINNHSSKPSDWVCEYIDTEHGKMLKISADTISTGYYSILIEQKVKHIINTEKPVGNEPTFYPRLNDTGTEYESYIFGGYNTSLNTKITIWIRLRGLKERGILGANQIEMYEDAIKYTITGEGDEWYLVNGILEKG